MNTTTRAFIALPLPENARRAIVRLQEDLAPRFPSFRWTRTDQLHLTLAFLGDAPNDRLAELRESLSAAVAPFAPLTLTVAGLGAFPTLDRPRVAWVGLEGADLDALRRLREAVAQAARDAGAPPADDRFSPHVTIGRPRPGRRPAGLLPVAEGLSRWSAGTHVVDAVVLYSSVLSPQGPIYGALKAAHLKGGKSPSPP